MPSIDLSLAELRRYVPSTEPPADLDAFWKRVVDEALSAPLDTELRASEARLARVSTFSVTFEGFGGGQVKGWYLRPEGEGPFPGVVSYHGYSGRGARPLELYTLAAQGIAVLSMDCRGQGGDSPGISTEAAFGGGWLVQGLEDPEHYYYRTVYGDAVRAAEVLCGFAEVDAERIAFTGVSQGGGLTLAAAALSPRARFAWADIPFLCDFPRAVEVATADPYPELPKLLRRRPDLHDQAFKTLSYFDAANLAPRISCPVVVTVSLWDDICPPSTIFGAFSRLEVDDRELVVQPFLGHTMAYETEERRLFTVLERLGVN
ncbi:MAG: alpha/beta fold hydrolase [Actinomycetota bacterium]|nr:alpha/beta fold hydrolase [Actinomycetota bacterium]